MVPFEVSGIEDIIVMEGQMQDYTVRLPQGEGGNWE